MRFSLLALASLVAGSVAAAVSPPSTSVRLQIPATHQLPNPYALPPSTKATLSSFHRRHTAPITTTSAFVFHNVTPGSYLVDIHCTTHGFAPLRLDVEVPAPDSEKQSLTLKAWETYRGNDWDNRGQAVALQNGAFEVPAVGVKNYFVERSKFSVFSVLKNPMILLGLVSMGIFFGMPYLVDNMDPEMRAEWEERQKTNPMNSLIGGAAGQQGANPMSNFDMAAFLAGSQKKGEGNDNGGVAKAENNKKRK